MVACATIAFGCRGEAERPAAVTPAPAAEAAPAVTAPPPDAAAHTGIAARVLAEIEAYPTAGGYAWPAPRGSHGMRRDLAAGGERFARATPDGSTHCSGLTFEVFWRAFEASPSRPALDADAARALMRLWFVPEHGGKGPAEALPTHGLGRVIDDLEAVQPGDFVQAWMNNGRGHTMIFLGWERDDAGAIVGLRHFSSHPSTGGAAVTTRAIGTGPSDIRREAIYIARAEW